MGYIPNTDADRQKMLDTIGVDSIEELFADVPVQKRFPKLDLPPALTELELSRTLAQMAGRNQHVGELACFLGAGAYQHFIPSLVDHILRRGEFLTAYTPYQPEISQGTLMSIYEYQSFICALTGMDVTNASMYEGASSLAEGILMAARLTRRDHVVMARNIHPEYRETARTYAQGIDMPLGEVGYDGRRGTIDLDALRREVSEETACVAVQYPNFFGLIEDLGSIAEIAHAKGAMLVVATNLTTLGLLRPPGAYEADIVVGEGQSVAVPLQYGGPYVGFLACKDKYVRQMPGRVVGMTHDMQDRRAFVMTLRTREQDIRREKATSNICTNQALVALAAAIYLGAMGKHGLRSVAEQCYQKAHYAAQQISQLPGYEMLFDGPFFHEFAVRGSHKPAEINAALLEQKILGGYDLGKVYPELAGAQLFCVTEINTKGQIDHLSAVLGRLNGKGGK
ncbi:MAG: aminomethyl-transferring glycine dehydrogenase subunit GcvPA [Chloroflexi bacterium]|nr:aminomethyl-transferring glycine dehydrogenase subunit GcvPA [Chloroflexota bacterium]